MQIGGCGCWSGLGLQTGVLELDVGAVQRGRVVREQADEGLAPLVEGVEALPQGGVEVDPVGVRLLLVPAGADPELEPPARDDVEGGGHLGEHGGVAVGHAGHEDADSQTFRGLGQGGRGDPALQAGAGRIREDRIEVVERPSRLEELDLVGGLPDGQHVRPRGVLRGGLHGEAHCGIVPQASRTDLRLCDR